MEREPQRPEEPRYNESASSALSDVQRIERGLMDARTEDRPIDDATARRIASLLHGGQASAIYSLASAGALPEQLEAEVQRTADELPAEYEGWTDALLTYIAARGPDRSRREGWAALTADEPEVAIEAARAAARHERRTRRLLFERYVASGMNEEDAMSTVEFGELLHELLAPLNDEVLLPQEGDSKSPNNLTEDN